jgi:glycosyltransferase involved in cell wall biosynthesis
MQSVGFDFPRASLFVATYEMPRHLELVCAGLERQSDLGFEVFFCDDGSGPETREVIQKFSKRVAFPVHHLWQENQGFRKCRILNRALAQARGEICIFLDGDCIPHRHFIRDHLQTFQPGYYSAGRRVELGEKLSSQITSKDILSGLFDYPHLSFIWSVIQGDSEYLNRAFRIPWKGLRKALGMNRVADLKGCNYSVARKDLEAINGFDENYEGYGREDTDVEVRLQNLGLKIQSLKGMALQFHVWHPRRQFTPKNDVSLEAVLKSGRIRCEKGLIQNQI